MRAFLLGAALMAGTNPAVPPDGAMSVSVTVPETVWNTPGLAATWSGPDGATVSVQDNRPGSPGWSVSRQVSNTGTITVTVLT